MKKLFVVITLCLFIGMSVLPSYAYNNLQKSNMFIFSGKILYVGGNGTGNYTKIQDAINNASIGDTVFVYDDSSPYYENVIINKFISLVGEDKNTTIIDGSNIGVVVTIYADWVNISGFTIQNSGDNGGDAGILLISTGYCTLKENIISNNYFGLNFVYSCFNNTIQKNIITDNYLGIIFGHNYPHHKYNQIYENNICSNIYGIYTITFRYNEIFSNNIMSNEQIGVYMSSCIDGGGLNNIYHNNYIYNGQQAVNAELLNYWDNGYPSGGNFWSDYLGLDNYSGPNQNIPGSDGIGDTPYPIQSFFYQEDSYPLMEVIDMGFPPIAEYNWTPILPEPGELVFFNASKSYDYDGFITLYEWDWDNDGEYDESHTNSTATHSWPYYGYYPVTLRVNSNNSEKDTKKIIVRVGNGLPYEPYDPLPVNGEMDVGADISYLCWDSGDPDGDPVTYDLYFGTSNPPPKLAVNETENRYHLPFMLNFGTTYYWKIVAWDDLGASTSGPIWSFTTSFIDLRVNIIKPKEKMLYFENKSLFYLPKNTLIFGYIDIYVIAGSDESIEKPDEGIEKIEFYINDKLKEKVFKAPYIYRWEAKSKFPFIYKIKVVAYHISGYNAIDEMVVWKFS